MTMAAARIKDGLESLFCSEDCRLCCEMVKFAWSIGIGNQ
jgi:hypothetical protein